MRKLNQNKGKRPKKRRASNIRRGQTTETKASRPTSVEPSNASFKLRLDQRWRTLKPINRHWIANIIFGLVIELFLHLALHNFHVNFLINAQNTAMDSVMRVQAAVGNSIEKAFPPPQQTLLAIDETTWRSPLWGGGEPLLAPREPLLKLIELAFKHGASQVVLDIAIEGSSPANGQPDADANFAAGLQSLLDENPDFDATRQLVLVRTLRWPLPQTIRNLRMPAALEELPYPAFPELREAPLIDKVIGNANLQANDRVKTQSKKPSTGKIILAAPYFRTNENDRVLRSWDLFQLICQRATQNEGEVQVIPSVQLAVFAHAAHVQLPPLSANAQQKCQPFRKNTMLSPMSNADYVKKVQELDGQENPMPVGAMDKRWHSYWENTRKVFRQAPISCKSEPCITEGIELSELGHSQNDVQNRLVFRTNRPVAVADAFFMEVAAHRVLPSNGQPALSDSALKNLFEKRVVVIGQTHSEARDTHRTPLGDMAGVMVLINAIDSIQRFGLIAPASTLQVLPLTLLSIVVVGYIFARLQSLYATILSTITALPIFALLSFYLFGHGLWLDLALPMLGLQIHRIWKSFEEWLEEQKTLGKSNLSGHDK